MIEKRAANIEKYEVLKKEIERFPSVFIEGAACCGKTTMVRQYLNYLDAENADRHPADIPYAGAFRSVRPASDRTDDPSRQLFSEKSQYGWSYRTLTWGVSDFDASLGDCLQWISGGSAVSGRILVLMYRINSLEMQDAEEHVRKICDVIRTMPEQNRIIIESREKPFHEVLDLIWHGQMGIISQQMLSLTEDEVRLLLENRESNLSAREVMELTGGWAGCIQMLITMEKTHYGNLLSGVSDPAQYKSQMNPSGKQERVSETLKHTRVKRTGLEDLMQMYEIWYFIREQILSTLTEEEQDCVSLIRQCGWATDEMIRFFIQPSFTGRPDPVRDFDELTENLVRKGILFRYEHSDRYHVRKMFCLYGEKNKGMSTRDQSGSSAVYSRTGDRIVGKGQVHFPENMLAFWYEEHGYLQEAADLFGEMPVHELYAFMVREYKQVPFLKINLAVLSELKINAYDVMQDGTHMNHAENGNLTGQSNNNSKSASFEHSAIESVTGSVPESELVFLCGIAALRSRDLQRYMACAEELDRRGGFREAEMLINLKFADGRCETADWYRLLERKSEPGKRFHLFAAKANLHSCLYGARELSDHFACLRREQNQYERLWKEYFGPDEAVLFLFARAEYLVETFQEDKITAEEREELVAQTGLHPDQFLPILLRIWALCRDHSQAPLPEDRMEVLFSGYTPDASSYQTIQLLRAVYAEQLENVFAYKKTEECAFFQSDFSDNFISRDPAYTRFNRVRYISENYAEILRLDPEEFQYQLFLLAKGLILLRQYTKAERVLRLLEPILQRLTCSRLHAEILFQIALVHQSQGRTALASQEVVESFAVTEPYRYAAFYTQYGEAGRELMTGYLDWMKKNATYRVHKKRYQYGSLLNVSQDEFVEVLIRKCRKTEIAVNKNRRNYESEVSGSLSGRVSSDMSAFGKPLSSNHDDRKKGLGRSLSGQSLSGHSADRTRSEITGKEEHLTMMELIILQDLQEGLSNQEICERENLKLPTVKSHLYNVYRKLGVKNRGQAVKSAVEREILKK